MDSLNHKAYKCPEIKSWNARIMCKDGFKNPKRAFTLPQLFIRKLLIFIF